MPDSKISGLTSATTPLAGTEVLPIVQGGQTRQVSVANLTAGRGISVTTLSMSGQLTNTLATGTAPFVISSTTRVSNLNVATAGTADTLTTTRTLWGQNFNGGANVTGSLTSVGDITGTAGVTLTATGGTLGLVATGANVITASTNGSERMRVTSAGDVGVGTNSPATKLDVNGTFAALSTFSTYTGDGLFNANARFSYITTPSAATLRLGYQDDGGGQYNPAIGFRAPATLGTGQTNYSNAIWSTTNGALAFGTGTAGSYSERMRVSSGGDVGIGTSSPGFKLDVVAAGTVTARVQNTTTSADAYFQAQNTVATGLFGVNATGQYMYTAQAVPLIFYNNATERARIGANGNMAIGSTDTSLGRLNVVGSAASSIPLVLDTNASYGEIQTYGSRPLYLNRQGNDVLANVGGGNFGIGTASPGVRLDVSGGSIRTTSWVDITPSTVTNNALYRSTNTGGVFYSGLDNSAGGLSGSAYAGVIWHTGAYPIVFSTNNLERMRLDSAGNLGLGVTPSAWNSTSKAIQISTFVSVSQQANGAANFGFNFYESGANSFTYSTTDEACRFSALTTGGFGWFTAPSGTINTAITFTQAMTLDASGNLGLGVTPSAWSGLRGFDIALGGALFAGTSQAGISSNAAFTGTNWVYKNTDTAAYFRATGNAFQWHQAASGTAGNTISFTQAMTLDASGSLLVGKTSASVGTDGAQFLTTGFSGVSAAGTTAFFLNRNTSDGTILEFGRNGVSAATMGVTSSALTIGTGGSERLRITSAGNIHTPAGSTTMTNGFIYIPAAAGAPTGVATAITGTVPLYYNSSANILYAYNSSWQTLIGTGTLPLISSNANGVVYLNSSSQATTSTALQFNGTELGIGQAASAGIQVDVATTALAQIRARATTNGVDSRLAANSSGLLGYVGTISNHDFAVYTNNTERMRITSAGVVGIGTSSPGGVGVHVQNNTGGALYYASGTVAAGGVTYLAHNASSAAGSTSTFTLWNDNGFSTSSVTIGFFSSGSTIPNEFRINQGANAPTTFHTNATERARICLGTAVFTASITNITMTVTAVTSGTIRVGMLLEGTNIYNGTYIIGLGTGSGGTGTYFVSINRTIASTTVTGTTPKLDLRDNQSSSFYAGLAPAPLSANRVQILPDFSGTVSVAAFQRLSANRTLGNSTSEPLFGTNNSGIFLPVGLYEFECFWGVTGMTTTTGRIGFAFSTATGVISYTYQALAAKDANALNVPNDSTFNFTCTSGDTDSLSKSTTATVGSVFVRGTLIVSTEGRIVPRARFGAGVNQANMSLVGRTYIIIKNLGEDALNAVSFTVGDWR